MLLCSIVSGTIVQSFNEGSVLGLVACAIRGTLDMPAADRCQNGVEGWSDENLLGASCSSAKGIGCCC